MDSNTYFGPGRARNTKRGKYILISWGDTINNTPNTNRKILLNNTTKRQQMHPNPRKSRIYQKNEKYDNVYTELEKYKMQKQYIKIQHKCHQNTKKY